MKLKIIIFILFVFNSCTSSIEHYLNNGELQLWVIVKYKYEGEEFDVINDLHLNSNIITFKKGNDCIIPINYAGKNKNLDDKKAKWYIDEKNLNLKIETSGNKYFNGEYTVCINKKGYGLRPTVNLKSENIEMTLVGGLNDNMNIHDKWECQN